MPLTSKEFDRVIGKLQMEGRSNDHKFVYFEHDGKKVVFTLRSHGRGDLGNAEFAIRRQLHVSSEQLRSLVTCPMSRADYVEHLKKKRVIEESPAEPSKL
jgi:hypothetical protein